MTEYIERDALKQRIREKFDGLIERIEINSVINAQPTADVVDVVRCKDCTRQMICFHSDDYFCADGERREDAT